MSDYGLRTLDGGECTDALSCQRVGRIALCLDHPVVLPVVYAMLDGDVVLRTAPGEKLIAAVLRRTVAFEIDDYDADAHTGWSVLVIGTAEEIVHPQDLERAHGLDLPAWAGSARDRFVRIRTTKISGRALGSHEPGSRT